MCGITGIYAFNELGRFSSIRLKASLDTLAKRGPDARNMSLHHHVNLGQARLSIIDLSAAANQPFRDATERYTIVFNGEIFNYRALRDRLVAQGVEFRTQSDTEVLLEAYKAWGVAAFNQLNGFFAFGIYDEQTQELLLARDRYGIKPLLIYQDEDKLFFASEMKALLGFGINKDLDYASLYQYLQFNYIPAPQTIFRHVRKLAPGHYLRILKRDITEGTYYEMPAPSEASRVVNPTDYAAQQQKLRELLDAAVQRRLIADVPLGAFLSGGIDSSIITALASRHTDRLNTFSIGYRDEPFFDETRYARLVADKFKTNHTVFKLSNDDLYAELFDILDYIDEPFADSSAIAVYILSKYTRRKVTVALSGDGADEMFSGYNKHAAELRARTGGWQANMVRSLLPLWRSLPQSRNGWLSNKVRQLRRFGESAMLSHQDRYWSWASFTSGDIARAMLSQASLDALDMQEAVARRQEILKYINNAPADAVAAFNEVLHTDMRLVLPNDMLMKVDLMSMANSLEVRVPFLDYEVVNFVMRLPAAYKITPKLRKRILQDAFHEVLPAELYNRSKHGFEVPLLKWLRGDLRSLITDDLMSDEFIATQGIFNLGAIQALKQQLFSPNPQDAHARVWAILVFQHWWKRYVGTNN